MWSSIAPILGTGGAVSVLAWVAYRLHLDAVLAERRRADDWKTAAEAAQARADLKEQQMGILLGRIREPTA